MIDPNDPRFLRVPNSPYIVLAGDSCLSKWAMESGDIRGEKHIRDLPCVQALQPGDVCLDIGGFLADTAVFFVERGADVWIFEPYPDCAEAIRVNCPQAHLVNAAVGDGRPMQAAGAFGEDNQNYGTRMVTPGGSPTIRVDDLNFPAVRLGKLDCEGCELMVLEGMRKTIDRCKPTLIIEVYDSMLVKQGATRQAVLDFLESVGYSWEVCIGRFEDERCDLLCNPKE